MKEEKIKTVVSKGRYDRITIVGKKGDTITIEIKKLPEDFSFAYTFFRNIEQECRLLKREIEKAQNHGDKGMATYFESALQFFKDHPVEKNFYVGGLSLSLVLDALKTLAFHGKLLFTTSVAGCVRERVDKEISIIRQVYGYCKEVESILPEKIDKVTKIIHRGGTEEGTIEKLQLEISLSAGAAECIYSLRFMLDFITDTDFTDLVIHYTESLKFLLSYLKHLKTITF